MTMYIYKVGLLTVKTRLIAQQCTTVHRMRWQDYVIITSSLHSGHTIIIECAFIPTVTMSIAMQMKHNGIATIYLVIKKAHTKKTCLCLQQHFGIKTAHDYVIIISTSFQTCIHTKVYQECANSQHSQCQLAVENAMKTTSLSFHTLFIAKHVSLYNGHAFITAAFVSSYSSQSPLK